MDETDTAVWVLDNAAYAADIAAAEARTWASAAAAVRDHERYASFALRRDDGLDLPAVVRDHLAAYIEHVAGRAAS